MKQQTSIHVQPVKGGSEQHNKREKLDYIRTELSHPQRVLGERHRRIDLKTSSRDTSNRQVRKMQSKATPDT